MTELTATERNRLTPWAVDADDLDDIAVAVAAILTARLARIEALAAWVETKRRDFSAGTPSEYGKGSLDSYGLVEIKLRAALAAPTPDEVQP